MHPRVAKVLEESGAHFRLIEHHRLAGPIKGPQDVAVALGIPLERITKSILLRGTLPTIHAVAVCAMTRRLDMKTLAKQLGCKKVEVASTRELAELTGYPPQGVSPIGLENMKVFVDAALSSFPSVLVGAGVAGTEIEIESLDLCRLVGAGVSDLTLVS